MHTVEQMKDWANLLLDLNNKESYTREDVRRIAILMAKHCNIFWQNYLDNIKISTYGQMKSDAKVITSKECKE